MEHTFLFKEGLWRVEGEFLDGTGNRISVEGTAHIRHYPDKWVYEGTLCPFHERRAEGLAGILEVTGRSRSLGVPHARRPAERRPRPLATPESTDLPEMGVPLGISLRRSVV
jgi:hypothetical protein